MQSLHLVSLQTKLLYSNQDLYIYGLLDGALLCWQSWWISISISGADGLLALLAEPAGLLDELVSFLQLVVSGPMSHQSRGYPSL